MIDEHSHSPLEPHPYRYLCFTVTPTKQEAHNYQILPFSYISRYRVACYMIYAKTWMS